LNTMCYEMKMLWSVLTLIIGVVLVAGGANTVDTLSEMKQMIGDKEHLQGIRPHVHQTRTQADVG